MTISRWVLLAFCAATTACYTRQPLGTAIPAPGARVVAEVTDSGTVAMGAALGPGVVEVEGVVRETSDTSWTLFMIRVDHRDGRSIPWNREPVSFPRGALTNATTVVLDRNRSWIAAAGSVAVALAVAGAFKLLGADSDDRGSGGPPPPEH